MSRNVGYLRNSAQHGSISSSQQRSNKMEVTPAIPLTKAAPDADLTRLAHTRHLLLVEDNAINQTIMVRMLKSFGSNKVDVAADGAEGLRMVTQRPLAYNLILMDISMPVMDGATATKKIREAGHAVPIVAMTANAFAYVQRLVLFPLSDSVSIKGRLAYDLRKALEILLGETSLEVEQRRNSSSGARLCERWPYTVAYIKSGMLIDCRRCCARTVVC